MTNNDLALIEDVEIRQPGDIAKMDDELHCPNCDGVICDVESGDSLGLLVRTALDHLAVCTDVCTCTDPAVACPACLRKRDRQGWPKDWRLDRHKPKPPGARKPCAWRRRSKSSSNASPN